jgi:hypothetical protein
MEGPGGWSTTDLLLGIVSRCFAPRTQDPPEGTSARDSVVHLRACSRRIEQAWPGHLRRDVWPRRREASRRQEPTVRFRGCGRSPRRRRRAVAVLGSTWRDSPKWSVLRWRSRPTDFPAAVFLESARRGRTRAVVDAADQLPNVTSDPNTGRPAPAMTRRFHRSNGLKASATKRIWRKFTTPNVTCYTSPARGRGIICWLAEPCLLLGRDRRLPLSLRVQSSPKIWRLGTRPQGGAESGGPDLPAYQHSDLFPS